jgi:hypothetical protein
VDSAWWVKKRKYLRPAASTDTISQTIKARYNLSLIICDATNITQQQEQNTKLCICLGMNNFK